jgi:CRP/FNR family transcriptional regulator
VLFFPRKDFIAQIKAEPALALNMLSVLSLRLKRFTALIDDLSLKEVPGRLAAYLLYLSDRNNDSDELDLDISKGQLASILGTIPETLSRILSRMSKEGVIELDGKRHFMLKDRSALEQLAQGEKKLA